MAARRPGRPKAKTTRRRSTTTTTKRPTTRRRRTTKKGMGELFSRRETEAGVKQLIGVGAGFVAGEYGGKFLNPNGDQDNIEIIGKLAGGFLASTTGRMPNFGAGIMASGIKKMIEVNKSLNNMVSPGKPLMDKAGKFLNEPMIEPSEYILNDQGEIVYLNDYTASYQSKNY